MAQIVLKKLEFVFTLCFVLYTNLCHSLLQAPYTIQFRNTGCINVKHRHWTTTRCRILCNFWPKPKPLHLS